MKRLSLFTLLFVCTMLQGIAVAQSSEAFDAFLEKFTGSAKYQYSRIKFPLNSPIVLLAGDGDTERSFPFTQDKWPLLSSDIFVEERIDEGDGMVYVSKFTLVEPAKRVFEAGFEESENDMRIEFALIDGKWYVVDCYTGWYGPDLYAEELNEAVKNVQEENADFKALHP